ncbi:MAG TPA: signal peptidase I [Clostridiales bacterium]|nr:signal peptidase I [Clostridiales bacterium]
MTKNKALKEILDWVLVIVIAIVLALLINKLVIYKVSPPTASMENTIMVDDKVITYRLAYLFSNPHRGDIIVFQAPDTPEEDYIKRVIGLPGETVEVIDGVVYIDGDPLEEDYLKEPMEGSFGPYEVPEGSYFMMGDNRNISWDARYWTEKFVKKDKIRGKAILKYPDFKWLY